MLMMLLWELIEVSFSATKVSSDFPKSHHIRITRVKVSSDFPKSHHIRITRVPSCGVVRGVVFSIFFAEEKFPTLK